MIRTIFVLMLMFMLMTLSIQANAKSNNGKNEKCSPVMDYGTGETFCVDNWENISYGDEAIKPRDIAFDRVDDLTKSMKENAKERRDYELKY